MFAPIKSIQTNVHGKTRFSCTHSYRLNTRLYKLQVPFKDFFSVWPEVKVSRNGPERRSGKRIIADTAFLLEFQVGWYYDADATMVVPELYKK